MTNDTRVIRIAYGRAFVTGSRAQNPGNARANGGRAFVVWEVTMADEPRATRNLTTDITHAHNQVKRARQDGGCEAIMFWTKRRDELLDTLSAQRKTGATH